MSLTSTYIRRFIRKLSKIEETFLWAVAVNLFSLLGPQLLGPELEPERRARPARVPAHGLQRAQGQGAQVAGKEKWN